MDVKKLRNDFPILKRKIHGKPLVYLDNAATTQKPQQVIDAISNYYTQNNANIHRGVHVLSEEATIAYEESHEKTAKFLGAQNNEIIFTKNTTESLNLAAYSLAKQFKKSDEIIISEMEHHSNFVPWQQLAKQYGFKIKFAQMNQDGSLNLDSIPFTNKTKLIALTHMSNALGTINPIKEICKIAQEKEVISVIDGAQSVPHIPINVKKLGCDFLAFSSHKMCGPTGMGVLFGRQEMLENMEPFLYGGDMIRKVTKKETTFNDIPWKFEAGTPNIAGAVGHAAAIDYLQKIGMQNIRNHEIALTKFALQTLSQIKEVQLFGINDAKKRGGVVSFNIQGVHPHDVSSILDSEGIAIRGGNHCAMPLMDILNINGTSRASFYLYNTEKEIEKLALAIKKAIKIFK